MIDLINVKWHEHEAHIDTTICILANVLWKHDYGAVINLLFESIIYLDIQTSTGGRDTTPTDYKTAW
jgi:hypothetical protein